MTFAFAFAILLGVVSAVTMIMANIEMSKGRWLSAIYLAVLACWLGIAFYGSLILHDTDRIQVVVESSTTTR